MLAAFEYIEQYYVKNGAIQEVQQEFIQSVSTIIADGFYHFGTELAEYRANESPLKRASLKADITNLLHALDHSDKEWRFSLDHYGSYLKIHSRNAIISTIQNKVRDMVDMKFKEINDRVSDLINSHFDKKKIEFELRPEDMVDFLSTYMMAVGGVVDTAAYTDLTTVVVDMISGIINKSFDTVFGHVTGLDQIFWSKKGLLEELIENLTTQLRQSSVMTKKITEKIQILFDQVKDCTPEASKLLLRDPVEIESVPNCKIYAEMKSCIEQFIALALFGRL